MIEVISIDSIHLFPGILKAIHQFRYEAFVQRNSVFSLVFNNLEYDQYDNLATVHFVWRDAERQIQGLSRINSTIRSYMIKDLWPYLVTDIPLPESNQVFEFSKLCLNHRLTSIQRQRIKRELVTAMMEYALIYDIHHFIGLLHPNLWRSLFTYSGWPVIPIGKTSRLINRWRILAGLLEISHLNLQRIYQLTGVQQKILSFKPCYRDNQI